VATARELLDALRARARNSADPGNFTVVLLVERDPILTRLIATWPNLRLPADQDPNEVCPPETPEDRRLRWLWSRIPGDPFGEWLRLAGLPDAAHTRRACWIAAENRMVLPDGTLAPALQGLVQALVTRAAIRLGAAPPPPPERRPAPPPPAPAPAVPVQGAP
jgi:hypothetical protein